MLNKDLTIFANMIYKYEPVSSWVNFSATETAVVDIT